MNIAHISLVLFITAGINLLLSLYSLRFIRSPGAPTFSLILLALSLYAFGYAMELKSSDVETILFWLRIQYTGIAFLPTLFIVLALYYTGAIKRLIYPLIAGMTLLSLATLFIQHTNPANLFYRSFQLVSHDQFVLAGFSKGPWYWVHQAYANLALLISCILYLRMMAGATGVNRIKASIMLFASLLPWLFYAIYLTGNSPHHIDLSPISFSIVGILTSAGIFWYHLLEYLPTALENVFESMTDGVVVLDKKFSLVSFNKSAASYIPDLRNLQPQSPATDLLTGLNLPLALQSPIEIDTAMGSGKNIRHFHVRAVPVYNLRNKIAGWAIVFMDITDRVLMENHLYAVEKHLNEVNKAKDKFLSIISHDLRNSFSLIINLSEMLLENVAADKKEPALNKGTIIHDTAQETYRLLENLLEWALVQHKGISPKLVSLQALELISSVIHHLKPLADHKELIIKSDIDPSLNFTGDENMLKLVIRNLISNAIKYSHRGGIISVFTTSENKRISINIRDEGVGMEAEDKQKLFQIGTSFSRQGTAKEMGTGLGLVLCYEFVKMHKGEMVVTSAPGKGSTFSVWIPIDGHRIV